MGDGAIPASQNELCELFVRCQLDTAVTKAGIALKCLCAAHKFCDSGGRLVGA
jgi:hypothetical protein